MQKIQKLIFNFVWNGKQDRISRQTAIKTVRKGGLNIPDIRNYIYALKLSWIRKFRNTNHKWASIAGIVYPFLQNLECYGSAITTKYTNINPFWTHVFRAYRSFCVCATPQNANELLSEPIFYNEKITVGNKVIKKIKLIEKGLFSIRHLIKENREFMSYRDFCKQFGFCIDFVTFNGWISSIKQFVRKMGIKIDNINGNGDTFSALRIIDSVHKGSNIYYECLTSNSTEPKCCSKWTEKLNEEINWKKVFRKTHKIKDIKLKWLQMRIIHRIVATNVVLHAMGVTNTTTCVICNNARDSIEHFLWDCAHIRRFWTRLEKLINDQCEHANSVKISRNIILFGVDNHLKTDTVFDFIIMFAKWYIYRCKVENDIPIVKIFIRQLNYRFKIEQYNAIIANDLNKFSTQWSHYKPMLEHVE